MTDSVAIDAKRILLRYGAPIAILDKVSEAHRIEFAREIAKTVLPDREPRLRQLLTERGYADFDVATWKGRGRKARPKQSAVAAAPPGSATPKGTAGRPTNSRPGGAVKAQAPEATAAKPESTQAKAAKTMSSEAKAAKPKAGKSQAAKPKASKRKAAKTKAAKTTAAKTKAAKTKAGGSRRTKAAKAARARSKPRARAEGATKRGKPKKKK